MKQYVIIGNSAAGISAAEAIRKNDVAAKILIFSDEDYPAYCRCLISYYLAGDVKEEKILYRPEDFYRENNIELFLNKKVARIDPKKSRITLEDKTQVSYDTLLIATGASPKLPETKGIKKRGVFGLRTIKDAKEISGLLPITKAACVLGGGLVGLKAAYALKKRNVGVKVVIKSRQVLSQMLDSEAAGFVQKRLEENGIEFILGEDVAEIIGNGDIKAIKLGSGKAFETSLVVVGKGVTPNMDPIKETEIKFNEGIITNNLLQANIANIYAAGDCAESFDLTLGGLCVNALWPVAVEQGRVAGANIAGGNLNYAGSLGMNSIEFFGLPAVSLGIYKVKDGEAGFEELKLHDTKANLYKKIILKDNFAVGAILVGDIKNSGVLLRLIRERIEVSSFKDKLLRENFGYPDIMALVKDKEHLYV
ncbi:MAG: FAD-dependent oxidoreductase [Candidatus Omnitrophica bacterium]|nr:FAD-dependent oxidoreductase [Candidatus Omnitrophota bacterium]MDD5592367.1 FAD-dependent oxidoreductase [Candidatus Omnitrophota bacterium]